MKKIISNPYEWGIDGKDYYVDLALKRHFQYIDVESTRPMSGSREDVYHLVDYGVTLKHFHSSHKVSITLYGSDDNVGEVEKIVMTTLREGLKEHKKSRTH